MFCTGGIRCEKAGPYMENAGFSNVYQLDGGILKYFEECADAHYDGDCFVFDRRVGIVGRFDVLGDVAALRALRDTLTPQLPPAQRSEFEARLRAAIRAENYELAAILRDELRLL